MIVQSKKEVLVHCLASKKSLELVRLIVHNRIDKRLKKQSIKLASNCEEKMRKAFPDNISDDLGVWTFWLQRMYAAPFVMQKCYEPTQLNIIDREIIAITEENYGNYANPPEYIIDNIGDITLFKEYLVYETTVC